MKTLLLMRHGKSSWKHAELPDHERPLNKRGKKDAPMMGKLLKAKELVPQKVLCSTALRARETVDLMREEGGIDFDIQYLGEFYLAESQTYLDAIYQLPDELERVMIVGHNPGLEGLVQMLGDKIESLPTAAIAYLVFPVKSWQDLRDKPQGELVEFWRPRELPEKEKHKK